VIVTCNDIECKNYKQGECVAQSLDHTADRICITGRRKVEAEYKDMIRDTKPIDYKECEKAVSN